MVDTVVESVEDDLTRASVESEKTGSGKNELNRDITTTLPQDIWSAEYPDGGVRAWLIVFGVSRHLDRKNYHSHLRLGSVYHLFNVCTAISVPSSFMV
jgi:hypothetical protein